MNTEKKESDLGPRSVTKPTIPQVTKVITILTLVLQTSCVHVQKDFHRPLELGSVNSAQFQEANVEDLKIKSLVYREEKFPLSDFFTEAWRGHLKTALEKFDIRYQEPNIESQILAELKEEGLLPVYLEIYNNGTNPISLAEQSFFLSGATQKVSALACSELPHQFERFNGKAVAANVVNVGAVTILVVGIGVILYAASHGQAESQFLGSVNSESNSSRVLLNDTHKTIHIDYRDYLISRVTLQPGEKRVGLVFFPTKEVVDLDSMRLEANLAL